jgi:hypothetical protein
MSVLDRTGHWFLPSCLGQCSIGRPIRPMPFLAKPLQTRQTETMTPEERFERIESNLLVLTEANRVSAEAQAVWQKDFQTAMSGLVESHTMTQKSLATLTASIAGDVDQSNARVQRLEENLDALIRAITSEHSNGKNPR